MSELEDLQKKLYTPERPELPAEEKVQAELPPPLVSPPMLPAEEDLPPVAWRRIKIGLGVFLLLAAVVAAFIFYRGFYAFRKDRVALTLSGPENIVAGQTAVWKVSIANRNESELKEGELVFNYPDYSQALDGDMIKETIKIDSLPAGRLYEKEFKAVVIGGEGFERDASVVFTFKPSSSNIAFETSADVVTKISSFPVTVSVSPPSETLSGEEIQVKIGLKNESETDFQGLRMRLEYPSGFKPKNSSEKLYDFNNVWRMESILPGESKELTIVGQVTGIPDESKVFRAFIEGQEADNWRIYKEGGGQMKLGVTPLSVVVSAKQSADKIKPNSYIDYTLTWKNNLDVPLANLTLKIKLEGDMFDFTNIFQSGSFNAGAKTIFWDKNNLPGLASIQPSAEDNLSFRIKLKDKITASNTLKVSAVMDSTSRPEGLSVSKISATGELTLQVPAN